MAHRLSTKAYVLYAVDSREEEHLARARPADQPEMCGLEGMDADGVWLRPPAEQVRSETPWHAGPVIWGGRCCGWTAGWACP